MPELTTAERRRRTAEWLRLQRQITRLHEARADVALEMEHAARVERDRLRAALEGIRDMTWPVGHAVTASRDMQANARAALEEASDADPT